jgi:DNA primase
VSVVDDIKDRLDIVDVVSGYLTLQKAGRNFKALCPFHTEKTPSFTVNPERQSWHCFGACATGGDAFSFVMRMERLEFGETLRHLAQKTGVTLQQRRDGDRSDDLYRINRETVRFYREVLASSEGQRAMAYLTERGVDANAVSAFHLGLSPRGRDRLGSHLHALGFDTERAVEAGVLHRGDDGTVRDFFWGRLMFPIHDRQGRVTGFGARSLDGSEPKYLNTRATPIFDKRATLYGLHMAVASIRERDTAVIVEGYMDVIAAHQFDYTNVVASMGTALTDQQVSLLKSTAKSFILALDPDAAGQEAALRSLESSWRVWPVAGSRRQPAPLYQRESVTLKIAALPPGRDPDELIRQDPGEWERLMREALPFMEFLIPAVAARYDLSTSDGKAQAAEAVLPLITANSNAFDQEHYFQMLAEVLDVSTEALEASVGRPGAHSYPRATGRPGQDPAKGASVSPLAGDRRDFLEDYILALLLGWPEFKEHARALTPHFHKIESREVFTWWLSCSTIDELRDHLDESLQEHLSYLNRIDLPPADRSSIEAALGQSIRRLEQRHLQELQEGLLASVDATVPPPRELEEAIVSVNTRLRELFSRPA